VDTHRRVNTVRDLGDLGLNWRYVDWRLGQGFSPAEISYVPGLELHHMLVEDPGLAPGLLVRIKPGILLLVLNVF